MNARRRQASLIAGAALIALTNAVALGGVAWNRSGETEGELKLGMRELRVTRSGFNRESSGVMLDLVWRVSVRNDRELSMWNSSGGIPAWLDEVKMKELGFVVPEVKTYEDLERRRGPSREVFLVLELDGPAWHSHLERVRARAAEQIGKASTQRTGQAEESVKQAMEWLRREEDEFSRLFAVDAGLDADALRRRYPDRARHAIVRGRIASAYQRNNNTNARLGYVESVEIDTLNVPYEYRRQLSGTDRYDSLHDEASEALKGSTVTVAFGRRLEPWIVAIDRAATTKP